ncbi:hypothetical protein AGMMS50225_05300 [Betaproteobacteria bacterium]|nr:hypothetical protein AGMMS50225_05300 [Betaproteobacteria bacterium]
MDRDASWRDRLTGVVPTEIGEMRVLLVGCGSVGSFVAAELVRAGIKKLTLVDPDIVEWHNLTRTVYGHGDVGIHKVDALRTHLLHIFNDLDVVTYSDAIENIDISLYLNTLGQADIVIVAVDDPKSQGYIDRYCYSLKKPVVVIGLYKGAKGGEIVIVYPPITPCYYCSTGGVRIVFSDIVDMDAVVRDRDYGTSRLTSEIALGVDIHFVSCAAVKVVLALLSMGQDGRLGRFLSLQQLEQGGNFIIFGMEPNYYLFPKCFGDTPGQHAFQSVWVKAERNPQCSVCGNPEVREKPRGVD